MGGGKEGWMGCVREQEGGRGVTEVRGGQMGMKNIVSWERVRQRQGKGSERNIVRVEQREGCMLRLMDG